MDSCWICGLRTAVVRDGDAFKVPCKRCGQYRITATLSASEGPIPQAEKYRLSFLNRQRSLDGRDPITLDSNSIKAVAGDLPLPKAHMKVDLLLMSLAKAYPKPGERLGLDLSHDYPFACAVDSGELKFHFRALKERGHVVGDGVAHITWAGWDRVSQLENEPLTSRNAFVAFKFSKEMLDNWKVGFGAAIEKAGFEPVLANFPQHNDRIDAKIIADIKRSRFIVADVTGANTGVYFEAGYALGLGRPVIWTCRSDSTGDMHFDTKQYNHILWKDHDDLREQLYVRIVATI